MHIIVTKKLSMYYNLLKFNLACKHKNIIDYSLQDWSFFKNFQIPQFEKSPGENTKCSSFLLKSQLYQAFSKTFGVTQAL